MGDLSRRLLLTLMPIIEVFGLSDPEMTVSERSDATDIDNDIAVRVVDTFLDIRNVSVPRTVKVLRTLGYRFPGDGGGGEYARCSAAPLHRLCMSSRDGEMWAFCGFQIDIRVAGAVGDGTVDDTSAIQAAFDAADSFSRSGGLAATVAIPYGRYRFTGTLEWRRHHVVGVGPFSSCLVYGGPSGATAVRRAQPFSNTKWTGIKFEVHDERSPPGMWIDLSNDDAYDFGDTIEDVYFGPTAPLGCCLRIVAPTNCFFRKLRFSFCAYGISVDMGKTNFHRVLALSEFTIDTSSGYVSGQHGALVRLEYSRDSASTLTLKLESGRIEGRSPLMISNGVVLMADGSGGPEGDLPDMPAAISIDNVAIQWSGAAVVRGGGYILYQETLNHNSAAVLCLGSVLHSGLVSVIGGRWRGNLPQLPTNVITHMVINGLPGYYQNK